MLVDSEEVSTIDPRRADPSLESWEQRYLEDIERIQRDVLGAIETMRSEYPAGDEEDAEKLSAAVVVLEHSHAAASAIDPHPKYQAIHDHLVEGTRLFIEAGSLMASNDFRELEEEAATRTAELMFQGSDEFQKLADAMLALEIVW